MGCRTVNSVTVIFDEFAHRGCLDVNRSLLFCAHLKNNQEILIKGFVLSKAQLINQQASCTSLSTCLQMSIFFILSINYELFDLQIENTEKCSSQTPQAKSGQWSKP